MSVADGPSQWSIEKFGFARAVALRKRIPAALDRAVARAMGAREASEMMTDHAFGPVRWKGQYEELFAHLHDLPDVTRIHPTRAQVDITVCGGHLLLPWHYAARGDIDMRAVRPGRRLNRLARDLLVLFGRRPEWEQDTLPMMPLTDEEARDRSDLREAVEQLAPDPTVVLIGYACNSEAGLLQVSWGEATLTRTDELDWGPVEELPLAGDPSRGRRGFAA